MFKPILFIFFTTIFLVAYQNCSEVTLSDMVEASTIPTFLLKVKVCDFEDYNTKIFYGYNRNLKAEDGYFYTDVDGDGLTDEFENNVTNKSKYGLSSQVRDSNLDGYDDLIVVRYDLDINAQNNLPACIGFNLDSDRDGINDCTEDLISSEKLKPDTDGDGIPDRLEAIHGLNALDTRDASTDLDGDGIANFEEIRMSTPVQLSNAQYPQFVPVEFDMEVLIGENCRLFTFANLPFYQYMNVNQFVVEILEQNNSGEVILRKVNYFIAKEHLIQGEFLVDMQKSLLFEGHSEGSL